MAKAVTTALRRLPLLAALLIAVPAFPSTAGAHRLDEYLQATLVAIEPGDIRLQMNLTPGVDVAEPVLALIDLNHDGVISDKEAAAYAGLLKRDLLVRLDGRRVELKLTASNICEPTELRTGGGIIQLEFSVNPGSLGSGAHRLVLENRHLSTVSVYLFNAAQPKSDLVQILSQKRNENQSVGEIEFTFHPPEASVGTAGIFAAIALPLVAMLAGTWWRRKSSPRPT